MQRGVMPMLSPMELPMCVHASARPPAAAGMYCPFYEQSQRHQQHTCWRTHTSSCTLQAVKRLQETLAWRQANSVERMACAACAARPGSHYMHPVGFDPAGRPLLYSCLQLASCRSVEDNRQHVIATFEQACTAHWGESSGFRGRLLPSALWCVEYGAGCHCPRRPSCGLKAVAEGSLWGCRTRCNFQACRGWVAAEAAHTCAREVQLGGWLAAGGAGVTIMPQPTTSGGGSAVSPAWTQCLMRLRQAIRLMRPGVEQWVIVSDFHGFGFGDLNPRMATAFLEVSARHYPERLCAFLVREARQPGVPAASRGCAASLCTCCAVSMPAPCGCMAPAGLCRPAVP